MKASSGTASETKTQVSNGDVAGSRAHLLAGHHTVLHPCCHRPQHRTPRSSREINIIYIFLFVSILYHIYFIHLEFTREAYC